MFTLIIVSEGLYRTIPKQTPFMLTGVGNDQDDDAITYSWEQIDFGAIQIPPRPTML